MEPAHSDDIKSDSSSDLNVLSSTKSASVTNNTQGSSVTTTVTDINSLTDHQVILLVQEKERKKQLERYARQVAKGQNVDKEHKFWNTQPVLGLKDTFEGESGPVEQSTDIALVKQTPYNMPAGFEWCSLDVTDPAVVSEIYSLLSENYVEDDDCLFRFDYSVSFLQWTLTPPGFVQDWHVGVRNLKTGALMGCITAIPADIRVHNKELAMVEINFLCVHKKLRSKRLAPVLIKEITRRVNLTGRWQAVYTAGVVLPTPVGRCRYWHRSLNPKKLVEIKFSSVPERSTLSAMVKSLKLSDRPLHDLRKMEAADVPAVHTLLCKSLAKRKLAQVFSEDDVAHTLLPRTGVVECWVLETKGKITDFCSYYHLPSTVFKCEKHTNLGAVYSYYNVATSIPYTELINDALVLARLSGADVYNALDLCDNESVFKDLKFGAGDGYLQYYVYNWKCSLIESEEVGLVLV